MYGGNERGGGWFGITNQWGSRASVHGNQRVWCTGSIRFRLECSWAVWLCFLCSSVTRYCEVTGACSCEIGRSSMKKLSGVILATFVLMLVGTAMSQSLADQAKAVRQQPKKSAAKVYTEDDLPSVPESKMAEESHAAEATATNAEAAKEAPSADTASVDADKKDDAASDATKEDDAAAKEKEEAAKAAAEAQANDFKAKVSD